VARQNTQFAAQTGHGNPFDTLRNNASLGRYNIELKKIRHKNGQWSVVSGQL
jgi:hypothetical protein